MSPIRLEAVARLVGGRLDGPGDLEVSDLKPVEVAGPSDLTFVKDDRHLARLAASRAGAVICRPEHDVGGRPAIRVENPRLAAAQVLSVLRPPPPVEPGVHPRAWVDEGADVAASAAVGPFAVVERGASIGPDAAIGPHAVVSAGCRVGARTRLDAHVVLYPGVVVGDDCHLHAGAVIGSPGFGYEMGPLGPVGFPQVGTVVLGNEVRIGANTTVDRATLEATRLGDGVKIDNLVQIGHNVTIEDGVIICAQSGVGGGAVFEKRSVLGPQGALAPDAVLGRGTILSARTALVSNQRLDGPGQVFMGVPAMPVESWKRLLVWRLRKGRERGPRAGEHDRPRDGSP